MNLTAPRYEIDFLTKEGKVDRNWYKYLALLGNSTGNSTTFLVDSQVDNLDLENADIQGLQAQVDDATLLASAALDPTDPVVVANPTAKVGITAVNGSAATFMRSDAAPPLDVTVNVTWTGSHAFQATVSPISIGGISYTGGLTFPVSNTSTVDGDTCRITVGAGATSLAIFSTNINQSTAIVTGGPTGAQSVVRTLGAQPVVFGAGNTYALGLDVSLAACPAQPNPSAVNATATLTIAQLLTQIITSTSAAAVTGTLPTGTLSDAGLMAGLSGANTSFDWSVINTGPNGFTVAAGVGHTLIGSGVVPTGTSGRFRSRKTAANTFITYRLS